MTPRTKEQNLKIREQTRHAIMEAAMQLFSRQGFFTTSMDDIAHRADVSKGLIYNHFSSKNDLLDTLIRHGFGEFEVMFGRIADIQTPKGKLKEFIEIALSKDLLESSHHRLFLSMLMQPAIFDRSQALVKQVFDQFIPILVTILDDAGFPDPHTEAWIIYAILDGIMLHYWFQQDNYPLDDVRRNILKRYNLNETIK